MECPNPKCDNKEMKCIVNASLTRARIQKRYICYCDASVVVEYDLYEE